MSKAKYEAIQALNLSAFKESLRQEAGLINSPPPFEFKYKLSSSDYEYKTTNPLLYILMKGQDDGLMQEVLKVIDREYFALNFQEICKIFFVNHNDMAQYGEGNKYDSNKHTDDVIQQALLQHNPAMITSLAALVEFHGKALEEPYIELALKKYQMPKREIAAIALNQYWSYKHGLPLVHPELNKEAMQDKLLKMFFGYRGKESIMDDATYSESMCSIERAIAIAIEQSNSSTPRYSPLHWAIAIAIAKNGRGNTFDGEIGIAVKTLLTMCRQNEGLVDKWFPGNHDIEFLNSIIELNPSLELRESIESIITTIQERLETQSLQHEIGMAQKANEKAFSDNMDILKKSVQSPQSDNFDECYIIIREMIANGQVDDVIKYQFSNEPGKPTLLHLATQHLRADLVKTLLFLGCDKASTNNNGLTALDILGFTEQDMEGGNYAEIEGLLNCMDNTVTALFDMPSPGQIEVGLLLSCFESMYSTFIERSAASSSASAHVPMQHFHPSSSSAAAATPVFSSSSSSSSSPPPSMLLPKSLNEYFDILVQNLDEVGLVKDHMGSMDSKLKLEKIIEGVCEVFPQSKDAFSILVQQAAKDGIYKELQELNKQQFTKYITDALTRMAKPVKPVFYESKEDNPIYNEAESGTLEKEPSLSSASSAPSRDNHQESQLLTSGSTPLLPLAGLPSADGDDSWGDD